MSKSAHVSRKSKARTSYTVVLTTPNGRKVTVHGVGALPPLDLYEGIDLTKPIFEQAVKASVATKR